MFCNHDQHGSELVYIPPGNVSYAAVLISADDVAIGGRVAPSCRY